MTKPPLDGGPWQNVSYWTNPGEQEDLYWERLIQGEAIRLSVEEARRAWPDHYEEYYLEDQQGYIAMYVEPLTLMYASDNIYKDWMSIILFIAW